VRQSSRTSMKRAASRPACSGVANETGRSINKALMATSIPPLVATRNSPTLVESYRGMKKERSFDLKALWTPPSA
jgi:hypothetical protein